MPAFWLGLVGLAVFYARLRWVGGPGRLDIAYDGSAFRGWAKQDGLRRAAERVTDEQCDELQALVGRMRDAARNKDMETLERIDTQFHERVCELSGSRIMLRVWLP